jgi:hypothetical protein
MGLIPKNTWTFACFLQANDNFTTNKALELPRIHVNANQPRRLEALSGGTGGI